MRFTSKGSAWGSWDLEPDTQLCHWSSKWPCHAPPLPRSHLDFGIWQMMCSLCLYLLPMQSTSCYKTEQTQGRGWGTAVQWLPGEMALADFGPSCARNMGNVGQGLHPAGGVHVDTPFGRGREFSYADASPIWFASLDAACKSRCNYCLQNRRWAENPLKAKGVFPFVLMGFGPGLLCLVRLVFGATEILKEHKNYLSVLWGAKALTWSI